MVNIKFSKQYKCYIIILLILLNFIIRIPSIPHENGVDSFSIHILANSVSNFGHAEWWAHPSSIFGFYPYSYASAVPFMLSGISQLTGIEMDSVIWIFSVIIGLFSIFTAYILAGIIINGDLFKFLVAFSFSLSPGILSFSTWDSSTRGLFMMLLPLFIYILLKIYSSTTYGDIIKFISIFIIYFILLMATHHYIFMTAPVILGFIIVILFTKLKLYKIIKIPNNIINIAFILCFLSLFVIPFFTGFLIKYGRYTQIYDIISNTIRYGGILIPFFAIPGLIYLSFKNNKGFGEWFMLVTILILTPLIYQETYAHFFMIIFESLLIGISIQNSAKNIFNTKKYASLLVMLLLIISVVFSGFYQHWRSGQVYEWYMDEHTYNGGLWIKENIVNDNRLVGYDELTGRKMFAISEKPTLVGQSPASMLTYGFVTLEGSNITMNSPLTTNFYLDNPFKLNSIRNNPENEYYFLSHQKLGNGFSDKIIKMHNISYVYNNGYYENEFIHSIKESKTNIYDNGKIRIWYLF